MCPWNVEPVSDLGHVPGMPWQGSGLCLDLGGAEGNSVEGNSAGLSSTGRSQIETRRTKLATVIQLPIDVALFPDYAPALSTGGLPFYKEARGESKQRRWQRTREIADWHYNAAGLWEGKQLQGWGTHAWTSTATSQDPMAGLTPWDNWGLIPLFQVFLQLRIALVIEN